MKPAKRVAVNRHQTIELIGDRQLVVEHRPAENVLQIVGADGRVSLSIHITPAGPVLRFEGSGLIVQTAGALEIDAQRVLIQGREGVAIASGGDAVIQVAGALSLQADAQQLTARLGDIEIRANDDVAVNGERIRMNC